MVWNQTKTLKNMTWQWLTCCFWWPERCLNTWCFLIECQWAWNRELQQSFCQAVSQALQQCASPFFRDERMVGSNIWRTLEGHHCSKFIGSELQRKDIGRFNFLLTIYITLRYATIGGSVRCPLRWGHHPMLSEPRYSDIVEDQCSWTDQRDGWNELLRSFFERKHIASSPNVRGLFKESHDNSLGWWHPKCCFKSSFQDVVFSHWVEILTKAAIVTKTPLVHLLSCSKDVKTVINFIALVTEWNQDNDMRRSLIRQPGLTSRVAIAALNKRLTAASPAVETPGETGKDVNESYSNESLGEEDSVEKERSLTDNLTNLLELWVHSISTTKCGWIFKAVLFQSSSADDQLIETYWNHHLKVSVFLPFTCNCFVGHKKV